MEVQKLREKLEGKTRRIRDMENEIENIEEGLQEARGVAGLLL